MRKPRDVKFKSVRGGAGAEFRLVWSNDFTKNLDKRTEAAQKTIDNEFLRYSLKKLPHRTGNFQQKTIIATAPLIGTGMVLYPGPFARYLYHGKLMVAPITRKGAFFSENYGYWSRPGVPKILTDKDLQFNGAPERGAKWAERTWDDDGEKIVNAAQKAFNSGKAKK